MSNPKVVITGGTGLLGSELVARLLKDGYDVITTTTQSEKAGNFRIDDRNLIVRQVDFLNPVSREEFYTYLKNDNGFEFLVNNARSLKFLESDEEGFCTTENFAAEIQMNTIIPYELSVLAANSSSKLQGVINISSQYGGSVPNPALYDSKAVMSPLQYNVSKAALNKLTQELAVRFADQNIRVNAIAYGGIKGRANADFVQRYEASAPQVRMLNLNECYGPLKLLLDTETSAINGQIIDASAGWTLC